MADKLAKDKEYYSNSAQCSQEKIDQLKEALDERRSAFATLQEKYAAIESSLRLNEQSNKRQQEYIDTLKSESARKEREHELTSAKLNEQMQQVEKMHVAAIRVTEDENSAMRNKVRELSSAVHKYTERMENMEKSTQDKDINHHRTLKESERKFSEEIDRLIGESTSRRQTDMDKNQKLEDENYRLEEEVSHLKSKVSVLRCSQIGQHQCSETPERGCMGGGQAKRGKSALFMTSYDHFDN